MAASAIGLVINAVDGTANAFDKINSRIEAFSKQTQARINAVTAPFRRLQAQISRFSDVSGLTRIGTALRGVARAGSEAYQKVGQVIPLIGIIGSAASIAGVTRMVEAWSDLGSKVGFTAQRIGISANRLSAFQGAARLAGSSAEGAANGLQALGQTMYDAIGGRNAGAVVMFRTLGIEFQSSAGHARSVADVLPEVADRIAAIKDPFAQAQVATTLFGGAAEDLLPFLRRGSAGIREYVETAKRYGAISDAGAAAANRLREAQARVSLAVEGLRNRIAERLEPILTPLLQHFAEWVATSPAVAQAVDWLGQKVVQLGRWIEGGGIQRFGTEMQHWGDVALGIMDAIGGPKLAIEALIAVMVGSFALKVITPWVTLASAITAATVKMTRFTALQAAGAGGAGLLGKLGGLLGGIGLAGMGWEGANLLQGATEPSGNGIANLLHNLMFDMNPYHWTQSYHAGQADGASASGNPSAPNGVPPAGPRFGPQIQTGPLQPSAFSNNNPTNLEFYPGQPGVVGRNGRWGVYDTAAHGIGAGFNQMLRDQAKGYTTISSEITHRSPPSENDTAGMIRDISRWSGLDPNATLNMRDPDVASRFMSAVIRRETGKTPSQADVSAGLAPYMPAQAAPMVAPQAQGAPMALNTAANSNAASKDSTVRLQIDGRMDKGMSMRVAGAQGAAVSGPLVERPQLLGAMP